MIAIEIGAVLNHPVEYPKNQARGTAFIWGLSYVMFQQKI